MHRDSRVIGVSEDLAWEAVVTRDSRFRDSFVYAVSSTGIYCLVTCPSRQPSRVNVSFHPTAEAADAAGFRPCKRCRPNGADPQRDVITHACHVLEAHGDGRMTLNELGREVGMSPTHLQRLFRARTGVSPKEYLGAIRVSRLKAGLAAGGDVSRSLYDAGFGSASAGYAAGDAHLGMTPATYRAGGAGATISYSISDCSLGKLLVARTERGLCAVSLGGDDGELVKFLREEFPVARLRPDPQPEATMVQRVVDLAEGSGESEDLPLDVRATAFQWRVWRQLRRIPTGQTRSYGEVAEAIGEPGAARAVARACATNPVALVIPCHRVVRADGSPAGYRWGADRKVALIANEAT